MSHSVFELMAWAKRQKTGAVGRKAVLMALAERCSESATCFPSQALLADETEQSERTVQRQLEALEADGFIVHTRRYEGRDGHQLARGKACNQYELLIDQPVNMSCWSGDQHDSDPPTNTTNEHDQHDTAMSYEVPLLNNHGLEQTTGACASLDPPALDIEPAGEHHLHGFDEFWAVYPRRVGKGNALKAWRKAIKLAPPDRIIEAARRRAEHETRFGTEMEFIAYPTSWLNGHGWDDDLEAEAAGKRAGTKVHQSRVALVEGLQEPDDFEARFNAAGQREIEAG